MIVSMLFAVMATTPTLEEAQTCRAHMELFIEEVAAGGDWWEQKAVEAGAPDDDGEAVRTIRARLESERAAEPERFRAGRMSCVDTAIDAGAVPGMGPA